MSLVQGFAQVAFSQDLKSEFDQVMPKCERLKVLDDGSVEEGSCPNLVLGGFQKITQNEPLNLLGRGFKDRRTGQYIALACQKNETQLNTNSDLDCDSVRFVYLVDSDNLFYIGPSIPLVHANQISAKTEIEGILKRIGTRVRKESKFINFSTGIKSTAAVMGGGILFQAGSRTIGKSLMIGGALYALFSGLLNNDISFQTRCLMSDDHSLLTNTNGWNWSIRPKKVNPKIFYHYLKVVQEWKN